MINLESLSKMTNIGSILQEKLIDVGINTPEELIVTGSKEAFIRIKAVDNTACYNMLCALEGAIQGIRWHNLTDEIKMELKSFFQSL
jgi:DNA transformation protein and related proteins